MTSHASTRVSGGRSGQAHHLPQLFLGDGAQAVRSDAQHVAMFGGTLAAHGGVRPTSEFAFEIEDPVLGRKIAHAYRVRTLPILG